MKIIYKIYYGKFFGCLCALLSTGLLAAITIPKAVAENNWGNDGNSGILHVRGILTESACRLEMESTHQDLWLGEVATGKLLRPGDRGTPVAFTLHIRDCLRSSTGSLDEITDTLFWTIRQPVVRVTFIAPANPENRRLVKVTGAAGFGLRIEDHNGNDIRLGYRGKPLILMPGQDELNYSVMLERTTASLVAGSYRAIVGVQLSYD